VKERERKKKEREREKRESNVRFLGLILPKGSAGSLTALDSHLGQSGDFSLTFELNVARDVGTQLQENI
jgi:hypothetical protein